MQQSQESIEPEIVYKIKKQDCKSIEDGKKKKVWAWIFFVLSLLYGLYPMDVIPDIPIVGWIDDITITAAAFINLIQQQFFQANDTLNELLKTLKWILFFAAVFVFLIAILIITLIVKN